MAHTISFLGTDADFPAAFRSLLEVPGEEVVLAAGVATDDAISGATGVLILVSPHLSGATALVADPSLPVLAIFGTRDKARRAKEVALRAAIPHALVTYVYDAGEAIAEDRPEALARLVADFIRRKEAFLVNDEDGLLTP